MTATSTDVTGIIETTVLPLLDRVQRHGPYWMASCPVSINHKHADAKQSLQVGISPKGGPHVLLTCHAGCDREDILAALKLEWRDIYLRTFAGYDPDPVATYTYSDASGTVAYRKTKHLARNGGKYFKFHVPDEIGGWRTGPGVMDGVDRILFRLPQMLAASQEPVWITEGEKDAEVLALHGEIATTPGGANDWRPEMAEWLTGREVLIVADKDTAGYKAAVRAWADLKPVAKFCWIVQARTGKDAADHFAAGYTVCDFDWLDL